MLQNCIWLQRKSEGEHESSRRLKTQFLIEMEGFDSVNEQILLIGIVKLLNFSLRLHPSKPPKLCFLIARKHFMLVACKWMPWHSVIILCAVVYKR